MNRTTPFIRLLSAGAAALALAWPAGMPHTALAAHLGPPRSRDPHVQPSAGNVPYLVGHVLPGHGTQTYSCASTDSWGAKAVPDAILADDHGHPIIHHSAGPMWTSLRDGSAVTGAVFYTDTLDARPGAIPWLLLRAVATRPGPAGGDRLSSTTWIQRVHTVGGVAPTGSCTPGATKSVPYTADYYFYRAADEAGTPTTPTTWHVIAGFSQLLPTGNGNTEAVNQFYPR